MELRPLLHLLILALLALQTVIAQQVQVDSLTCSQYEAAMEQGMEAVEQQYASIPSHSKSLSQYHTYLLDHSKIASGSTCDNSVTPTQLVTMLSNVNPRNRIPKLKGSPSAHCFCFASPQDNATSDCDSFCQTLVKNGNPGAVLLHGENERFCYKCEAPVSASKAVGIVTAVGVGAAVGAVGGASAAPGTAGGATAGSMWPLIYLAQGSVLAGLCSAVGDTFKEFASALSWLNFDFDINVKTSVVEGCGATKLVSTLISVTIVNWLVVLVRYNMHCMVRGRAFSKLRKGLASTAGLTLYSATRAGITGASECFGMSFLALVVLLSLAAFVIFTLWWLKKRLSAMVPRQICYTEYESSTRTSQTMWRGLKLQEAEAQKVDWKRRIYTLAEMWNTLHASGSWGINEGSHQSQISIDSSTPLPSEAANQVQSKASQSLVDPEGDTDCTMMIPALLAKQLVFGTMLGLLQQAPVVQVVTLFVFTVVESMAFIRFRPANDRFSNLQHCVVSLNSSLLYFLAFIGSVAGSARNGVADAMLAFTFMTAIFTCVGSIQKQSKTIATTVKTLLQMLGVKSKNGQEMHPNSQESNVVETPTAKEEEAVEGHGQKV